MGGAFVAVASDSSATWWNPAGLASGPFFDMALMRGVVDTDDQLPAWRQRMSGLALGTPALGLSYYRFWLTDIQPPDPTAEERPGRNTGEAGVPIHSLLASQLGVTLVQTLLPGVHTGATLKYLRGRLSAGQSDEPASPGELLDRGDGLSGGDTEGRFDLDLGVLATAGVVRLGARVRNALEATFGPVRMERQTRLGVAVAPEAVGGVPLTVAIDADVDAYTVATGRRRVVAVGGEQWFLGRRLGVRAGGRLNTVGARERSAAAGASVAVRTGWYIDGHVVRGGAADEEGWGVAARVSF